MKHLRTAQILGAAILSAAGTAQAVSFTQGDVTLDINGTVNGYYVNRETKTTSAAGVTTTTNNSALTNGLLPGWINFVATTQANGQDLKAHISFAPGISNNSNTVGLPIGNPNPSSGTPANPYSQVDTRNVYFQFGNNNWGTLKFGRDIGLFGQDVILSDMTLIGVGGTSNAGIPYNTTFGMIGHGYMYTGFQPQITYTTPMTGGLQASAGIFQPSKFAGDETKTPGFQAKASYDFKGQGATGKLWVGGVSQNTNCSNASNCNGAPGNPGKSFSANGFELGGKAGFGNFEAMLYTFTGKGLGLSTVGAQFFGGGNGTGSKTDSRGYFAQATYKLGDTKFGINFGENRDRNGFALTGAGVSNEIKNRAATLGAYHSLNKYITLVGEFNEERITNTQDTGNKDRNRTLSLGGIMFF
ncbi:MAG: porin [Actinomycetota bacterium]